MFSMLKRQDAGMDWILHLDTDELIHPAGAREYSLRQLLLEVPGNVDMVIFPNYVSRICMFFFVYCSCIPHGNGKELQCCN